MGTSRGSCVERARAYLVRKRIGLAYCPPLPLLLCPTLLPLHLVISCAFVSILVCLFPLPSFQETVEVEFELPDPIRSYDINSEPAPYIRIPRCRYSEVSDTGRCKCTAIRCYLSLY